MINPYRWPHPPQNTTTPQAPKIRVTQDTTTYGERMWRWACTSCTHVFSGSGFRAAWNTAVEDGLLHLRTRHTIHPTAIHQKEYQSA